MKTLKAVRIVAVCLAISGCTTTKQATCGREGSGDVTMIRITANVDGSDRFIFTPQEVRYEHKAWSPVTDVTFNGEPWTDLDESPPGWRDLGTQLDLSRARIAERHGRDVIALELTANGFDLYWCDSPGGSEEYDVTIAVPRLLEHGR